MYGIWINIFYNWFKNMEIWQEEKIMIQKAEVNRTKPLNLL